MASLARPRIGIFLLLALAWLAPLASRAEALSLTAYTIAPETIYPSAAASSSLATSSVIDIALSARAKVSIRLLDASGAAVRTLYSSAGVTNPEPKLWDGADAAGAFVAPGAYTVEIAATSTATSSETLLDASRAITVALPGAGEPPPDFDTQAYSVLYSAGWSLLSLPVIPSDPEAASVFAGPGVESVWSYDPAAPGAVGGWLVFDPAHPELSTLAQAAPGAGYFLHARANGALAGAGAPFFAPGMPPPARALAAGWNLVGSFATSSESLDDAFASIGWAGIDYTALFTLSPGTSSFGLPSAIAPGGAYWIFTAAPGTYVPSDL
jgi:hypothetical protein